MTALKLTINQKLNRLKNTMLYQHNIFASEYKESALIRQFGKPAKFPRNTSFELSEDKEIIDKYMSIREQAYKAASGKESFYGYDEFDNKSSIILVKNGSVCIGGARLTVSSPNNPQAIPLETEDFKIKEIFPEIDYNKLSYCEVSRLALLPEFRTGEVMLELSRFMLEYCLKNSIQLGFARSNPARVRRFKVIFDKLGYNYFEKFNIEMPIDKTKDLADLVFTCADFTPDGRYTSYLKEAKVKEVVFDKDLEFA